MSETTQETAINRAVVPCQLGKLIGAGKSWVLVFKTEAEASEAAARVNAYPDLVAALEQAQHFLVVGNMHQAIRTIASALSKAGA